MPCRTTYEEPDDGDEGEEDYLHPDEITYDPELDDHESEFTTGDSPEVPCPHCGATITEDHQRCPRCEQFITKEDAPPTPKSKWHLALFAITLLAIVILLLRGS